MNARLNDAEIRETEDWWNQLSEDAKIELNQLYNNVESGDKEAEENGVELIPIAVYGEFVEDERRDRREQVQNDIWREGFLEYLINHEIYITGWGRTFHLGGTCRAHPKARKALKSGFVPANYTCPYQDKSCPMRKLLSKQPGKSLRLLPRFKK